MKKDGKKIRAAVLLGEMWVLAVLVAIVLSVGIGCGYRFIGSGRFPSGIQSVGVSVFNNRTSQTGAETVFTNSIAYEISRRGDVALASAEEAMATLTGTVTAVRTTTASHQQTYVSAERRIYVTLSVQLVDASGTLVWGDDKIKGDEVYAVADDKLQTEENKKAALSRLSEKMAESIYNRLISNF